MTDEKKALVNKYRQATKHIENGNISLAVIYGVCFIMFIAALALCCGLNIFSDEPLTPSDIFMYFLGFNFSLVYFVSVGNRITVFKRNRTISSAGTRTALKGDPYSLSTMEMLPFDREIQLLSALKDIITVLLMTMALILLSNLSVASARFQDKALGAVPTITAVATLFFLLSTLNAYIMITTRSKKILRLTSVFYYIGVIMLCIFYFATMFLEKGINSVDISIGILESLSGIPAIIFSAFVLLGIYLHYRYRVCPGAKNSPWESE